MDDELMTRQEVAMYLKVSLRTVYNYWLKGWLPAVRLGRKVLYRRADVLRLTDAGSKYDAKVRSARQP